MYKKLSALLRLVGLLLMLPTRGAAADIPWTPQQANAWYAQQPWLVGSNFIPSTAINELGKMWQADSFDLPTIDRELGWAQSLGMNTMRVLYNLLWQQDSAGFVNRMDQFLTVAEKHHIRIMFVLLDSVWDPNPATGQTTRTAAARSQFGLAAGPGC